MLAKISGGKGVVHSGDFVDEEAEEGARDVGGGEAGASSFMVAVAVVAVVAEIDVGLVGKLKIGGAA